MEVKNIKNLLLACLAGITLFAPACKKTDTTDVTTLPVVISYLIPGQPISIKVYQQKAITDTAVYGPAITGLKLSLGDGSKSYSLTETAAGTYTYADNSILVAGKTYLLSFSYLNNAVTATALMPAKPTGYTTNYNYVYPSASRPSITVTIAPAFTLRWDNPDSLYHVVVFKNDDTNPGGVSYTMNFPVNFTLNARQAAYLDVYASSFHYYGIYRAILYSVDKVYADILTSNANTSSQQLTNPPGNITNGYGIFTAMQADTIKITAN